MGPRRDVDPRDPTLPCTTHTRSKEGRGPYLEPGPSRVESRLQSPHSSQGLDNSVGGDEFTG